MADETTTEWIKYLPADIIIEILSWLPIENLLTCKCVCKRWQGIIEHSDFVKVQLKRSVSLPPRIILKVSPRKLYLLDLDQKKAREMTSVNAKMSELSDVYSSRREPGWRARGVEQAMMAQRQLSVMSSCDSFLCLASERSMHPVVVCNPITTDHMVLPTSTHSFGSSRHNVCLGFDRLAKKYKAVRVYSNYSQVTGFEICTLGETDSVWRQLEASYRVVIWANMGPVHSEGALYWILDKKFHEEFILVLNLATETFQTVEFPPNLGPTLYRSHIELLNLGGYVTLVQDNHRYLQMWRITSDGVGKFDVRRSIGYNDPHWNHFRKEEMVCYMDKDSFVQKVTFHEHNKHELVHYFVERKQYITLNIDRLPESFSCTSMRPNLVSPPNCGSGAELFT